MLIRAQTKDGDAELTIGALAGDKDAFCKLVDRHRSTLVALCQRVLGDTQATEDVVQEAILQALLNLGRLRRPDSFGPWLAGIGLNLSRRMIRRRQRDCLLWEGARALDPDLGESPEDLAEARDTARRVREAIEALPSGQRKAVAAFYLAGFGYAETAELLGVNLGSVKTRLHRARSNLRRRLWATWKEAQMGAKTNGEALQVRIADVRRQPGETDAARYCVLVLEQINGTRRLPIWVGQAEGGAIALQLENVEVPRPLTYSFMAKLLTSLGGALHEVRIAKLTGDTFYATALVEGPKGPVTVDARPSDALALALATSAPIFVQPDVFDASDAWHAANPDPAHRAWQEESAEGAAVIVAEITSKWKWPGFGTQPGKR